MPSGGHARTGPPPDPNALRRDRDKAEWRQLPRSGRKGKAPPFPLDDPTEREMHFWASYWHKPQAVMWEANGQVEEVALFVRTLVEAEKAHAATRTRLLAKQYMDTLGLSVPGLRFNRWTIVDDSDRPKAQRPASSASAKSRFRVVS